MIPRRLPIPNTPRAVDIDDQGVSEREDGDKGEGAGGEEGSFGGLGAEVDYEGRHGAYVD